MTYFHGGVAGLDVGDFLIPSTPHGFDGCPICEARRLGLVCTVGEYRRWLVQFGDRALPILTQLAGEPDDMPIDPPSQHKAVYFTTSHDYARWHAARSVNGDLYEVEPVGEMRASEEDVFPTWLAREARIVRVVERRVRLDRKFRRDLSRQWARADRKRGRAA